MKTQKIMSILVFMSFVTPTFATPTSTLAPPTVAKPTVAANIPCQAEAEAAAVAKEQASNKKEKFKAQNTTKEVDTKTETTFVTEVHDSKGSFVPYDIVVKKVGCKIVSAKATTL